MTLRTVALIALALRTIALIASALTVTVSLIALALRTISLIASALAVTVSLIALALRTVSLVASALAVTITLIALALRTVSLIASALAVSLITAALTVALVTLALRTLLLWCRGAFCRRLLYRSRSRHCWCWCWCCRCWCLSLHWLYFLSLRLCLFCSRFLNRFLLPWPGAVLRTVYRSNFFLRSFACSGCPLTLCFSSVIWSSLSISVLFFQIIYSLFTPFICLLCQFVILHTYYLRFVDSLISR